MPKLVFLLCLEDDLPSVNFLDFEERVGAYVDNVVVVGEMRATSSPLTQFSGSLRPSWGPS
jgi:hypothetical protein